MMRRMATESVKEQRQVKDQRQQILSGVVETLLRDLKEGIGDRDRRRQVEEWMRTLAEKYPEFKIEVGLRDYYLGATLTTRHLMYEKETEAALGLPPGVHSYAILPIGYPMGKFGPVGRGRPLAEIVFQDRWNNRYVAV